MPGKPFWDARASVGIALLTMTIALSSQSAIGQTVPPANGVLNAPDFSLPPLPPQLAGATPPSGDAPQPGTNTADAGLAQTACSTCGGDGQLTHPGSIPLACTSCGGSGCVPGRKKGQEFHYHTIVGRFFGNLYECLCCPDPCYEPSWIPEANAGFFVDNARPRTIQRIRYTHVNDMLTPDRNEFFWARENIGSGGGRGPGAPKNFKHFRGEKSLDFDQLSFYQEAATERASLFVEIPYTATNPVYTNRHSGFSDMNTGTKALFFDCELLQLAFQFKTYIPIGNTTKGLGTGHVSLEPSLLGTLRLAPETFLQGQLAEWIPIGGDTTYQGSILHYHFSFNHVLLRFAEDMPLIGTFEMSGYSFQTGAYTDPNFAVPQRYSGGQTYFSLGPGLRTSICNRVDFGGAVSIPVTEPNYGTWYRLELRVLY